MSKPFGIVDSDGILNNLYPYWLGMYGIDYNVHIDIDMIDDWELAKFCPHGEVIYKYLEQPGFFKYAPVMPGAKSGMRRLAEKYNLLIYTACDNLPHAYSDKATFLDYHFPNVPKLIGKNHKHRMKADFLIDDSPNNQRAFKSNQPDSKVVSIEWPYNRIHSPAAIPTKTCWAGDKNAPDKNVPIVDCLAPNYYNPEEAWDTMVEYLLKTV